MNKLFFLAVLLIGMVFPAAGKESIRIVGSSTLLPLISEAAKRYRQTHPDLEILISGGGSGVGIAAILQNSADLGMTSRLPTATEQVQLKTRAKLIPIAYDGVAVAVSKAIVSHGVKALSLAQIAAIYRGQLRNWKKVGGPDAQILVIDKESGRGTRHVFAQAVLGNPHARAPGAAIVTGSNNEEQAIIARSDQAIGMLSHAWLNDKVRPLGVMINGQAIMPTTENIRNGRYPIHRKLSLIVPNHHSPAVDNFIAFLLSKSGQDVVEQVGYIPIR